MLLAQIDRAPERLKPILHQVRFRSMLRTIETFLLAYPPEKMEAFITTLDALAEVWPHVKARGISPQNLAPAGQKPSKVSQGGTHDGV